MMKKVLFPEILPTLASWIVKKTDIPPRRFREIGFDYPSSGKND
jgi:hypothetical protein